MTAAETQRTKLRPIIIAIAMIFPTIVTLVYFIWLRNSEAWIQQSAYAILKTIQFGLPIGWFLLDRSFFDHVGKTVVRFRTRTQMLGVGFGIAVALLIFGVYFFWLNGTADAANLISTAQEKLNGLNLDSVWKYAALGLGYSLFHSFMEEYYWRWFVFRGCQRYMRFSSAAILSSLGFMAHHVILLTHYFGWDSWLAYLFSLGIAVGGFVWAWLYQISNSLLGPWLSHLVVDAAIFGLGYFLIKDILH